MKFCGSCGAQRQPDARFCGRCGQPLGFAPPHLPAPPPALLPVPPPAVPLPAVPSPPPGAAVPERAPRRRTGALVHWLVTAVLALAGAGAALAVTAAVETESTHVTGSSP